MKNKLLIVLAIMVVTLPSGLFGQNSQQTNGGELSPDVSWRIENNTLYISGKGIVPSTMFGAKSAWNSHRSLFNSVVIEDGITDVGQSLFVGYQNITSLTIAGSVKDISINAFNSCKKLSVVEVKGATPPDINLSMFYKVKLKSAKLIVPAGTKAIYEADLLWNQFGTIEESNQPAAIQPDPVKTLTEPCAIHLTRTTNFVGGGVSVQVVFNGVEMGKLGNGKTLETQTYQDKNELFILQGKRKIAARRFDATTGGDINIDFSYFNGYMKVIGVNSEE